VSGICVKKFCTCQPISHRPLSPRRSWRWIHDNQTLMVYIMSSAVTVTRQWN